jgi:3-phenylpropionate/trans-cinnamate dioxygenase ferredoxin subunit
MGTWKEAADVSEFTATDRKLVDFGGTLQIGLYKIGEEYFATSAWCSHQRAIIVHGDIVDGQIECPLHAARFDLKTGKNLCLPAVRPIARYDVKVENGKIFIHV